MGTKLQCKPYLPVYYSMRDLNEDANASSWSLFCDDKMLANRQYYNGFTPRPVDGYSEYDKEILRQTMLKHEATFRKQVFELHRLYRIQRDMMDELQKKELYGCSMSGESAKSNPFSSRTPSEFTQSMWQMPSSVNSSYCEPSVSGIDSRRSSLHFLKESSFLPGASATQNGGSIKDYELVDSKYKKIPRKMFDLQLPADEYIETEDRQGADKEKVDEMSLGSSYSLNRSCLIKSKSGVSLNFGAGENPNCGGSVWKLESNGESRCQSRCVADLNEPIQDMCNEKIEASCSTNLLGQMAFHKVKQGHEIPVELNSGIPVPQRSFFLDNQKGGDRKTDLNIVHFGSEEERKENLPYQHELGRNNANSCKPFYCLNKLPMSTEPLQLEAKKGELPQFLFPNQNKKETWAREKTTCGADNASPGFSTSKYLVQVAPSVPNLLSATVNEVNPSSTALCRNSTNNLLACPISIQPLPCFNEPAPLNLHNKTSNLSMQGASAAEKWDLHGCSKSSQSLLSYKTQESNPSSLQCMEFEKPKGGGLREQNETHGPGKFLKGLHCTDVKSAKDVHLNIYLSNKLQAEDEPSRDPAMGFCKEGENGVPSGILWLRKFACNESAISRGGSTPLDLGLSACSQPLSLPDSKTWPSGSGTGNLKDISLVFVPEPAPSLHSPDAVSQIKMGNSVSGTKILGFPLSKNSDASKRHSIFDSLSVLCQDQPEGSYHLPCDVASSEMEKKPDFVENPDSQKGAESSPSGHRHCINLNFTASSWDELSEASEFSSKADVENLMALRRASVDNTTGIDLEAPISLQEDGAHLDIESLTSQLETPAQVQQCERKDSLAHLARVAAETIVDISSAVCDNSWMTNCNPSSLTDSLLWFSEVVSSNECNLGSLVRVSTGEAEVDNESSGSGDDSFEALTLKLTETKVEVESCNKRWENEKQKDEVLGPSPWLIRPRKRQGRRGRQRKDFQRDILPGLVTLSRNEVTEDLQMIGGLMRASGCSWQMGVERKNATRNGWHCQARGRRPSRGSAAVAGNAVSLPQRQPINSEVEVDGISLRGWGKTTRRCRRQRFRTGNFSTQLI